MHVPPYSGSGREELINLLELSPSITRFSQILRLSDSLCSNVQSYSPKECKRFERAVPRSLASQESKFLAIHAREMFRFTAFTSAGL